MKIAFLILKYGAISINRNLLSGYEAAGLVTTLSAREAPLLKEALRQGPKGTSLIELEYNLS